MFAYKLFRIRKDGSIGSLFINKKAKLPLNIWLKAENYPTKNFKIRPGWHCTQFPYAPHLSLKNRVWYQVEIEDFEIIKRPQSQGGIWFLANWIKILDIQDF